MGPPEAPSAERHFELAGVEQDGGASREGSKEVHLFTVGFSWHCLELHSDIFSPSSGTICAAWVPPVNQSPGQSASKLPHHMRSVLSLLLMIFHVKTQRFRRCGTAASCSSLACMTYCANLFGLLTTPLNLNALCKQSCVICGRSNGTLLQHSRGKSSR